MVIKKPNEIFNFFCFEIIGIVKSRAMKTKKKSAINVIEIFGLK